MTIRKEEIETLKKIIKVFYKPDFKGGLFNTKNVTNDKMITIYKSNDIQLDICINYDYFEVFGLTENEFKELQNFYDNLE